MNEVISALKERLKGRGHIDLGQFQIINLDLVRLKTGERWSAIRDKIFSISEHFIEKRLDSGDVLVRCSEGFLVVFAELDLEAACRRVEQISTELNCFFLGDEILRSLRIRSRSERVSTARLAEIMAARGAHDSPEVAAPTRPANDNRHNRETGRITPIDYAFRLKESIVFRPVWDSRHQAVTTQFATPRLTETLTGRIYFGYEALRGGDKSQDYFELDRRTTDEGLRQLAEGVGNGRHLSVCVPVHTRTLLTRATRLQFFNLLATLPEYLRRYFFIRIDGIDSGTPASTIQDMCRTLHPFAASTLARLPANYRHFERFAGCGVTVIGCDLPDHRFNEAISPSVVETIERFERGAALLKAATYFAELQSLRVLKRAMSGGNRFFTGNLIADETELPASAYPHQLSDIRQRAAARRMQ
ncbi:hypothetical protein L5876_05905 [Hyphobacterium sp. SN044]|uniref:hypothetical protein n=1 Tax=Hyphobacterium sp. SN044 TaxID=2912575 RepID=UPI001F2EF24A|nr:hypothetical protein [Hyphobacterium sp. SN044]MCF8879343.1 hypothetical protein [Hyphobacterium sp. SN044]